jgi:hypothetical protein
MDGHIVVAIIIEIARSHRRPEPVALFGSRRHIGTIQMPQLLGSRYGIGAAIKDMDGTCVLNAADILTRHANRQIVISIAVKIAVNRSINRGSLKSQTTTKHGNHNQSAHQRPNHSSRKHNLQPFTSDDVEIA